MVFIAIWLLWHGILGMGLGWVAWRCSPLYLNERVGDLTPVQVVRDQEIPILNPKLLDSRCLCKEPGHRGQCTRYTGTRDRTWEAWMDDRTAGRCPLPYPKPQPFWALD